MFPDVLADRSLSDRSRTREDGHGGTFALMFWPQGQITWAGDDRGRLIWQIVPREFGVLAR
ncbi:hypothetical protein GCM10023190_03010 [Enteractinococcus fodinae]